MLSTLSEFVFVLLLFTSVVILCLALFSLLNATLLIQLPMLWCVWDATCKEPWCWSLSPSHSCLLLQLLKRKTWINMWPHHLDIKSSLYFSLPNNPHVFQFQRTTYRASYLSSQYSLLKYVTNMRK
jgi:hypothetical protein